MDNKEKEGGQDFQDDDTSRVLNTEHKLNSSINEEESTIVRLLKQKRFYFLKHLNISGNKMGLPSILALTTGLILNQPSREGFSKTLSSLNLSKNKLGPKGTQLLCESLKDHSGIHNLNIAHNYIGDSGAISLGKLLERQIKKSSSQ